MTAFTHWRTLRKIWRRGKKSDTIRAMTHSILNPLELPADLLPAEEEFVRCMREGTRCVVGNRFLPERPIECGDSGNKANVIRPEVIGFFAYGGTGEGGAHPVRGSMITLQGAWIGKKSGGGGKWQGLEEVTLNLRHMNIPYGLFFSWCHFAVKVDMMHMKCAALYMDGSKLAHGMCADGMEVEGGVHLRNGFSAGNEVRLIGATIKGPLDCSQGTFNRPLVANGLTTQDNVYLCDNFVAAGGVWLSGANIGRHLKCDGGEFHNPEGCALNVSSTVINGTLMWRKMLGGGRLRLEHAKVGVLADDADSWKPFKVVLDGFTYNSFAGPVDTQSRLDWLSNRPQGMHFSPLPYEQAAKVLFGMGQAREAREILLEKERLQTKDERTPRHHKIGRRLWDVFAGYGYRLRKTATWMAGFVLAGAVFFGIAAHHGKIVPHQPPILSSAEYQAERAKGLSPMESVQAAFPKEYPEFSPLAYSLDVFIPFFALHQEPFWSPASGGDSDLWKASLLLALLVAAALALGGLASLLANWIRREWGDDFAGAGAAGVGMAAVLLLLGVGFAAGFAHAWLDFDLVAWLADWRWLTVWHWLEIGAGWVLTSLFLLSITGLLRPRQSSGEKG